jgi:hypothetical protein
VAAQARGHVRRGAQAVAAVAVAAVAAALRGDELPLAATTAHWPELTSTESAVEVARWLAGGVPPQLALGAAALAAISVAIPYARTPWRIAVLGAAGLGLLVAAAPAAPALPLVAGIWLTCAGLTGLRLRSEH